MPAPARARTGRLAVAASLALSGCLAPDGGDGPADGAGLRYRGVETVLLDREIVNLRVALSGAAGREAVSRYAECAAAQYALIRGYGFARHVRTNVTFQAGIWRADAVYTISATLPPGLRTIDAEVTVRACAEDGVPTV